ncbi:MAG: FkbM family methyltransferase [Clostridiales bacterium]|nr:FkbM family methyltransferase [Clostridiales bacterium]
MTDIEMLEKIKQLLKNPVKADIKKITDSFKDKTVLIYGAGSFGKEMFSFLKESGITVSAFLDRNAQKLGSVMSAEVFSLESFNQDKSNTVVIMSIVCDKDIRKKILSDIKDAGFSNIIEAQSIRCLMVDFTKGYCLDGAFEKIEDIYKRLADEKSKKIYLQNILAHLSRNYSECGELEDNMDKQYFPDDIKSVKGYSSFIDCGGFIGDTVEQLLKRTTPKRVVSFEPFIDNYKKLSEFCQSQRDKGIEFTLMNNAVSDKIAKLTFATGTGSGAISENGDTVITAVSIDEALVGIEPTFLKMDIEGSEIDALKGAYNTIKASKPDMAICVYHNIEHLWEIPYYIKSIDSDYEFYFRNYNAFTMETVLYAYNRKEV